MSAARSAWVHRVQRYYPWGLGLAAGLIMLAVLRHRTEPLRNLKELLSAALSIDAIVVGFVATAKTMIASLDGKRPVENAKRRGAWPLIVGYTTSAVNVSMGGMALSTLLLLATPNPPAVWYQALVALWLAALVATGGAYHRVAMLLGEMLKNLHEPEPVPKKLEPVKGDDVHPA